MNVDGCDIVWANGKEELEHILDGFEEKLEANTTVLAAIGRIENRLYNGNGWSQADCDLVGEWLDEMQSGFYDCEAIAENGEVVAQGAWIAVDARDYKARLVGKEVANYV